ncbi:MAG TPA: NADH:ubiquinone oxidoreductase [Methanoculleus sp.]|nr:NADH:ubiquinone oxidoreductase [Methanoculleus sp.]
MIGEFWSINAPALLIAIPMLGAFATPLLGKMGKTPRNLWILLITALTFATSALLAAEVYTTGPVIYTFGAVDPAVALVSDSGGIPVRIIFNVDAMSAFMALMASVVGLVAGIYSLPSGKMKSGRDGYFSLLLLLLVGILGMVCTGDLFNFFVFLEISSLAGAALVAYRIDKGVAVEAGLKYAFLSSLAGLIFLYAVALLYGQYDSLNIAVIAERMQFGFLDKVALALFLTGLAMKAGAVPMHFWMPDTYSMAPSAITAFLVVSSQASLYGVFRIAFTLYGLRLNYVTVGWFIIILGVLSMLVGVSMAILQENVKRLMAYHSISQTGYMLLGVGVGLAVLGDPAMMESFGLTAMEGGLFHLVNNAMYKGLLFLTAGAIFFRAGTHNLNKLGGLGHSMKLTMLFFIIGALAIAGIPPFNGFSSKLMIYESVFAFNPLLAIIAMVVSILTLASFVKVFHAIFMGPKRGEYAGVNEVPVPMLAAMGILALLTVLMGIFPQQFVDLMIRPAAGALVNQGSYIASVMGGL